MNAPNSLYLCYVLKKQFLILVAILWALTVHAQAPYGSLERYKDGMKLDGRVLSFHEQGVILSDIGGKDYTSEWLRYLHLREEGQKCIMIGSIIASIGAGALLGIGAVYFGGMLGVIPFAALAGSESEQVFDDYYSAFAPWIIGSGAVAAAGAATVLIGVTILVVNNRRMSDICGKYNESGITLQIGLTPSGAGLALLF